MIKINDLMQIPRLHTHTYIAFSIGRSMRRASSTFWILKFRTFAFNEKELLMEVE